MYIKNLNQTRIFCPINPPIRVFLPSNQKVKRVVRELIGAEQLKAGGESVTRWLHAVIVQVWSSYVNPPEKRPSHSNL